MTLFERVEKKVGLISHEHSHPVYHSSNGENYTSSAVINNQKAFKALCEIVEEELNVLEKKMNIMGFITEEDMKI